MRNESRTRPETETVPEREGQGVLEEPPKPSKIAEAEDHPDDVHGFISGNCKWKRLYA